MYSRIESESDRPNYGMVWQERDLDLEHLYPQPYLDLHQSLPHPTQNVNYFLIPTHKHEKLDSINRETI